MGVLGKDLFDYTRPQTHVKVQFGAMGYWIESRTVMLPYGTILTELLNYDARPYQESLTAFEEMLKGQNRERAEPAFYALGDAFSALPFYRLFYRDAFLTRGIFLDEAREAFIDDILSKDGADMDQYRWAAEDITLIQTRYRWFLEKLGEGVVPEKKKGQRKKPLAWQICEHHLEPFVSGVSLGLSRKVDAPPVNIQYAVIETRDNTYELVEKIYFDRLADFIYVEFMRGLQKGFVPKKCANCGRWFLQEPGMSFSYCDGPDPGADGASCRDVGAKASFLAKVRNNPIWEVHQRAYKKYFARTRKGTMGRADFEVWCREAERIRDEALQRYARALAAEEKDAIVQRTRKLLNQA